MIGDNDFLDPWGNHWQVVDYRDIQFTKTPRLLEGMGLTGLEKSERALASCAPRVSPISAAASMAANASLAPGAARTAPGAPTRPHAPRRRRAARPRGAHERQPASTSARLGARFEVRVPGCVGTMFHSSTSVRDIQLPQHPLHDRRRRLRRPFAAELTLRRERDARDAARRDSPAPRRRASAARRVRLAQILDRAALAAARRAAPRRTG